MVGEIDRLCVVVWRREVTRPRFAKQRAGLAEVAHKHPNGMGFICVVEPTAPPPGDELRRASADMIREHEGALLGVACVVEGTGFVAALARSVLSAIAMLLGPRRTPLSIVGTVAAATAWLAPKMKIADPTALARAIESLRAELPG